MNSRIWWGLLIFSMGAVVVASGWSLLHEAGDAKKVRAVAVLERRVPSFMLTDQNGRPFASDSLLGKVWIADFIFTSCTGSCPQMTTQMKKLQQTLPEEVHLVSITVDPKRDTPQVLARYAQEAQAQATRWHFLTGEPSLIQHLAQNGFLLAASDGGSAREPIVHSVRFVLVDPAGVIRGFYDGQDTKAVEQLIQAAQRLAQAEEPE